MFNPSAYWNSRPDGFPVLEVNDDNHKSRQFVPLKRTELGGTVTGPLAALSVTQTFGYSQEQCGRVLEAIYRFPLPGDAAVSGVTVRFGDVEIIAELKERQQAEAEYEEAKREGRQAALTTRESPDVFTLRVAGIQPDEDVIVTTRYVQLAREESGGYWSLRVPLTTAPRYTRSDESNSTFAQGQPLALMRDPGHRFTMNVRLDSATDIGSDTHTLTTHDEEGGIRAQLTEGEVLPDRDLVLRWRAAAEANRPSLKVFAHADGTESPLYFLAQVTPPKTGKPEEPIAREVILLVDHSGSMEGAKWEAADWAVIRFLSSLNERDTFALGLFHNSTYWFEKQPAAATAQRVDEAIRFLQAHKDSGGTELGVALEQAVHLSTSNRSSACSRHILIVTDAEVSDAGRLVRLADEASRKNPEERRRISVLCIDAAPNSFLANELAERGGGIARFLTSQPEEEDITTALDAILEEWAEPVLYGLKLQVNRPGVEASGTAVHREPDASEIDLGDLSGGRARWVAGRIPNPQAGSVSFSLTSGFGRRERTIAEWQEESPRYARRPEIKALFGARRVLALEFLENGDYDKKELEERLTRLGYDNSALTTSDEKRLYAENRREDAQKIVRSLLVREALEFGLASSQTSFIATRKEAGKPVEESVAVANALPSGWSEGFLSPGMPVMCVAAPTMAPQLTGIANVRRQCAPSLDMLYQSAPSGKPSPAPASPPAKGGSGIVGFLQGLFSKSDATDADVIQTEAVYEVAAEPVEEPSSHNRYLFEQTPTFAGDRATLFDSRQGMGPLSSAGTLSRLTLEFPKGKPDAAALDTGLELLLFMDDLASPRARVRLSDLLRMGGTRPLNLRYNAGAVILVVLADPNQAWSAGNAPEMALVLE